MNSMILSKIGEMLVNESHDTLKHSVDPVTGDRFAYAALNFSLGRTAAIIDVATLMGVDSDELAHQMQLERDWQEALIEHIRREDQARRDSTLGGYYVE